MGILEKAEKLRSIAISIANEKGITEQEAWNDAVVIFRDKYERYKNLNKLFVFNLEEFF